MSKWRTVHGLAGAPLLDCGVFGYLTSSVVLALFRQVWKTTIAVPFMAVATVLFFFMAQD